MKIGADCALTQHFYSANLIDKGPDKMGDMTDTQGGYSKYLLSKSSFLLLALITQ